MSLSSIILFLSDFKLSFSISVDFGESIGLKLSTKSRFLSMNKQTIGINVITNNIEKVRRGPYFV